MREDNKEHDEVAQGNKRENQNTQQSCGGPSGDGSPREHPNRDDRQRENETCTEDRRKRGQCSNSDAVREGHEHPSAVHEEAQQVHSRAAGVSLPACARNRRDANVQAHQGGGIAEVEIGVQQDSACEPASIGGIVAAAYSCSSEDPEEGAKEEVHDTEAVS